MNYFRPGFVEGLVPNRCCKRSRVEGSGLGSDDGDTVIVQIFSLNWWNKIHFVYQKIDACCRGELREGLNDRAVGEEISVEVARLNVEDIYEDPNIGKDMLPLLIKVVFHKGILSVSMLASQADIGRTAEL